MISDILLLNVLNSRIVPSDWSTVGETIYNILNLSVYRLWEHNVSIESLLLNAVDAVYGVRPFTPSKYLNTIDIYRPVDSCDWQDISLAHALYFTKIHTTEEKSDTHLVALGLCPLLTAYGTGELRSRFIEAIETSSHTGWDNILDYIAIFGRTRELRAQQPVFSSTQWETYLQGRAGSHYGGRAYDKR